MGFAGRSSSSADLFEALNRDAIPSTLSPQGGGALLGQQPTADPQPPIYLQQQLRTGQATRDPATSTALRHATAFLEEVC